ncbi:MAG TPA: NAD(P)/FAD-dependent oxidoreductase [Amnibacterium sp.]|nr:NAD(P)/FAD-dependent oxidoreductase [Amnibacterium sp.]
MTESAEIVIVGGGHNGLTAAAYLAQAGRSVVVLERAEAVGGAAVSASPFAGVDARLSRYSYLVSLLPARIREDLGLRLTLRRRRYASYTPQPGTDRGLLVDTGDHAATAASFAAVGAAADAGAYDRWLADTAALAAAVWPTLLEPLPAESAVRQRVDPRIWQELVATPLGATLAARFASDLVRGMVATDGLIGTFASLDDPSLAQNVCLLYHVIGGGTGDWDVPVGGMGAVTSALEDAARRAGATIVTGAEVTAITPDGEVTASIGGEQRVFAAGTVLAGVAPAVLDRLLGRRASAPEGAQIKANVLLSRLPRLKDRSVAPEAAFAGTFHVHAAASELDAAHAAALGGEVPDPLPLETYCHSLTDPTILGPGLRAEGVQTLTVFGLQAPHRLGLDRDAAQAAVLASIDGVLDEPIEDLLLSDADGRPAIEVRTTADLEASLGMPGGHIFHGPLSLPWRPDDAPAGTAAERWGVATADPRILLCGSGSVRGGAVSGLGGYAAARAVLEG